MSTLLTLGGVRSGAVRTARSLLLIAAVVVAFTFTWGHGGPPQTKAVGTNAVAKVITATQDLIDGPQSRGVLGDYLLANSEIQVVIQDVQRNLMTVGTFGGQILDADLVRAAGDPERDSFEEWAFGINVENTAHYTSVSIVNDGSNGQPAVIRATGVDDLLDFINPSSQVADFGFTLPAQLDDVDLPIEITTDYILAPKDRFVQVETTVTNTGLVAVETFFTDLMAGSSGPVELFMPGYGFGEVLLTNACALCNFIAFSGEGQSDGVSYGYIHNILNTTSFATAGVTISLLGESVALALLGIASPNFTIAPGGDVTVTRYFAVGDGSVGSIVDIRNGILGLTTGTLKGTVTRAGSPVEGADVAVLGDPLDGPGTPKNVVSHYRTDANGQYEGTLPPGDYTVLANLDGHLAATPNPGNVTVTAAGTTVQDFTIPVTGRVRVTIVDENSASIAGRASFIGFDPYPDPQNVPGETGIFDEIFADRLAFGLANVVFVDQTGDSGEFFLEPGDYQVVVSHGLEYSIFEQPITVTAGALTTVNAQIAQVIDTSGFISGDFHIHAINSPDGEVTNDERIISVLAEGVDLIAPSDHQFRTDFAPVIASLGVGSLVSVAPGSENTTSDYGHFNAWPMTIDPNQVNGGALDWASEGVPPVPPPAGQDFPSFGNFMMPPAEIFANLLADPGVNTVQINHIDSFFGPGGLAIDTGLVPPQHTADAAAKRLDPTIANLFDDAFTAMEIWEGTQRNNINARFIGTNLGDWFNLINQGIVRTGLAVSDTHQRFIKQSGFPRTMVASPTDDPGAIGAIADTIAANVNAGRAIGTNAPFVRVTTEATSTGETGGLALGLPTLISTTDGNATITVNIQSPLWAEFDTVEFYVNDVPIADDFDNDPATPPLYRATPTVVQTAGVDFTVSVVDDFPLISEAKHLEATTSLKLSGLKVDAWVVVLVRGKDGVSEPIFPVVPNDLDSAANTTLANLTDGNLGEDGVLATAFTNPLFIDVNGNGTFDPPFTQGIGGLSVDLDGDLGDLPLELETTAASGSSLAVLAAVAVAIAVGAVTLGGAAWYARRRVR